MRWRATAVSAGVMTAFLAGIAPRQAVAQLSPGTLSQAHAALDGSGGCLQCHSSEKGVDPGLCLACHTLLEQRIGAGKGLHARPEYRACETCHIEHHGREFETVWWGPDGEAAFDHRATGYELEGAHRPLACRDCHQASHIVDRERLRAAGKDLARTFLGLDTACLSCHSDEHRGQFEPSSCRDCHQLEAWRPASLFDHDRTAWPLTGRHRDVSCEHCHDVVDPIAGEPWFQYRGITAASCSDCHRDPHQQRLGTDCAGCHVTDGWQVVDRREFDHDSTRYPLRGRHVGVACESCHGARSAGRGATLRIAGFDRCATCHADPHFAQFRGRADGDDCSACHDLNGFLPTRFGLADHQRSAYPLAGAHLAVACPACHQIVPASNLPTPAASLPTTPASLPTTPASQPLAAEVRRFRFPSTACTECHRDPHAGDAEPYLGSAGCVACHQLSTWRAIDFDHARTGFALQGRHRDLACVDCHQPTGRGTAAAEVRLSSLPATAAEDCRQCHEDPHLGQFDTGPRATACAECHSPESWTPVGFDHGRDTLFALHGAHAEAACSSCHPVARQAGRSFVRYRPLARACADCHRQELP